MEKKPGRPANASITRRPLPNVDYDKISWRLDASFRPARRVPTGITSIDKYLGGGLPKSVIVFKGGSGSGKTFLANAISKHGQFEKVYYFICQVGDDAPDPNKFPHCHRIFYLDQMDPRYALAHIMCWVEQDKPDLIVIDSMTNMFGGSLKAMEESDIREAIGVVYRGLNGKVPIILLSEMRGVGFSEQPAGGRGIEHRCSLLIDFKQMVIKHESQEIYGDMGEVVYLIRTVKDSANVMSTALHRIVYDKRIPKFIPIH